MPHLSWTIFFLVQTIIITCIYLLAYLLAFFIALNFKKLLTGDPELWRSANFGPNMVHFPHFFFFFLGGGDCYHFHLPIGPLHCAKFTKNSYRRSRVMMIYHFLSQNGQLLQMISFSENLLTSLVTFIHASMHAMSDINLLMKRWRLKNTEMPLADCHFWL